MTAEPTLESIEAALAQTWLPIVDADGYEVSNLGNVRSWWMRGGKSARTRADAPRNLRPRGAKGKYQSVSLPSIQGAGYSSRTIHSLVLLAFMGPRPAGMEVAHLDGNPENNALSNLTYVTHHENEHHKREHGTWWLRRTHTTLSVPEVAEIKHYLSRGASRSELANVFGVTWALVADIDKGRTWPDVVAVNPAERDRLAVDGPGVKITARPYWIPEVTR